jgi:dipeptidyl-peptidase-4
MIKLPRRFLLFPLLVSTLMAQLTLEDIFIERAYTPPAYHIDRWIDDGAAFLVAKPTDQGTVILRHDVASGEETVLLSGDFLRPAPSDDPDITVSYRRSGDGRWLLVAGGERRIWRRSREALYYLHDLQTGTTRRLTKDNRPQSNATFSPDNRMVAYVMANDLHVCDLATGKTKRLTKDGSEAIINGQADWLYEEEFSLTRAYEWSPDSKSILYLRFDQGHLPTYPLKDELQQYPQLTLVRYPKVGEDNSLVKVGVLDVKRGRTRWLDTGPETDIYIPRIDWTGREGEAVFYRLDRRQQRLELVLADARTGRTHVAATQTDPAWVDVTDDLNFIDGGDHFLWTSEESGYRHIYLLSSDSDQNQGLTSGEWEVHEILDVDEEARLVYFAGNKDRVVERHIYQVAFDGSEPQRLSESGGWNTFDFAPGFAHYIQERSDVNTPNQTSLHTADGSLVRELGTPPPESPLDLDLPAWEFFTLTTTDGADLNAVILKPKDFKPSSVYPTVIYTYGGPGSQLVTDRWMGSRGRGLWHQYLAQEEYIILTVDNRGTGRRGKEFKNLAYGDIGKWALNDQVEAARWVARQSWADPDRIAIWGWSGGGYLTSLCLTAGTEYFKCGIAVAPVTDFRLYDTAWTERYMGLLPENQAGYESADVLIYADQYKGGLLLIHGTGDDNVHPQHSWQFIQEMTTRNMPFDLMMYPGKNHGLPGVHYHLYSKMTVFLKRNL